MLPNTNRLKGNKAIEEVKRRGKLFQSKNFGFVVLEREDVGPSRFGFVISTKISKAAVHRNRVLRALREAVRRSIPRFPKGIDALFLTKKSILTKTTEEIMREVEKFVKNFEIK